MARHSVKICEKFKSAIRIRIKTWKLLFLKHQFAEKMRQGVKK